MGHTGLIENLNFQSVESYFDLHLNEETSRYIFRIAIIKHLMINAKSTVSNFLQSPVIS